MAEIPFLLGAAFLNQAARGTPTSMAAIGAGAGTSNAIDNVTDGAVLGDAESGVGSTGISVSLGKKLTEKAVLTGSYTRDFANFVSRTVESFDITVPLKGNGETTTGTPVASDFTPDIGIVALLRAAGLTGGASGAVWRFIPASTNLVTAALYFGNTAADNGGRIILEDVEAESMTLAFTPGVAASMSLSLSGVFSSHDETGTWPANPFQYANQASLSAPAVTSVGFTWGPDTPAARSIGFSELSIVIDNEADAVPSSNAASGEVPTQTDRNITITGTIDATDGEILYEIDQLGESLIANAEQLVFTVGTVATGSDTANAYRITVDDPELVGLEQADPLGNSQSWAVELRARSASANGEFKLDYL
jgi:hypothetical protein